MGVRPAPSDIGWLAESEMLVAVGGLRTCGGRKGRNIVGYGGGEGGERWVEWPPH